MEVQLELAEQIAFEVRRAAMTHAQLARLAGTSRPRVTSILNGNLDGVSTDLLFRVLAALGVRVNSSFTGLLSARVRAAHDSGTARAKSHPGRDLLTGT